MSSALAVSLQFQRTRRHRKWLRLAFWSAVLLAIGLAVHSVLFGPTSPSSGLIGVLLGLVDLAACCGVPVCLMCAFIAWIRRPQNDLKDLVRLAPALSREWAEALLAEHGPTLKSLGLDPVVVVAHHAAADADPEKISAQIYRFVKTREMSIEIVRLASLKMHPTIYDLVVRFEPELDALQLPRSRKVDLFVQALRSEATGPEEAVQLMQQAIAVERERRETVKQLRLVGSKAWVGKAHELDLESEVQSAFEAGGNRSDMLKRLENRLEQLSALWQVAQEAGIQRTSLNVRSELRQVIDSGDDFEAMVVMIRDIVANAIRRQEEEQQRRQVEQRFREEQERIKLYGGSEQFVIAASVGEVLVGMTTHAVRFALGQPQIVKRQATQEKWYFKPYESSRGQTKYRLEVTVKDGLVTAVKDL